MRLIVTCIEMAPASRRWGHFASGRSRRRVASRRIRPSTAPASPRPSLGSGRWRTPPGRRGGPAGPRHTGKGLDGNGP